MYSLAGLSYSLNATENDRKVFLWNYENQPVTQGYWIIKQVSKNPDIFLLLNSSHSEYLINSRDEYSWAGHHVYTSGMGSSASKLPECLWEIKVTD